MNLMTGFGIQRCMVRDAALKCIYQAQDIEPEHQAIERHVSALLQRLGLQNQLQNLLRALVPDHARYGGGMICETARQAVAWRAGLNRQKKAEPPECARYGYSEIVALKSRGWVEVRYRNDCSTEY